MIKINATAATGTNTATAIFPPADSPPGLDVGLLDAVDRVVGVTDADEDDLVEDVCVALAVVVSEAAEEKVTKRVEGGGCCVTITTLASGAGGEVAIFSGEATVAAG